MISARPPRSWYATRIGTVQPLSALLPAVLRRYGLEWEPDPAPGPVVETLGGRSGGLGAAVPATCLVGTGFDDSRMAE